ncbi:unnamed protein product [Amoebophrya sp. A25]|nr:unnamed protein product [Amoebophrya sp. A25]|eukprot:GSA25T00015896001.1
MECELVSVSILTSVLPTLKLGKTQRVLLEAKADTLQFTALNPAKDVRAVMWFRREIFSRYEFRESTSTSSTSNGAGGEDGGAGEPAGVPAEDGSGGGGPGILNQAEAGAAGEEQGENNSGAAENSVYSCVDPDGQVVHRILLDLDCLLNSLSIWRGSAALRARLDPEAQRLELFLAIDGGGSTCRLRSLALSEENIQIYHQIGELMNRLRNTDAREEFAMQGREKVDYLWQAFACDSLTQERGGGDYGGGGGGGVSNSMFQSTGRIIAIRRTAEGNALEISTESVRGERSFVRAHLSEHVFDVFAKPPAVAHQVSGKTTNTRAMSLATTSAIPSSTTNHAGRHDGGIATTSNAVQPVPASKLDTERGVEFSMMNVCTFLPRALEKAQGARLFIYSKGVLSLNCVCKADDSEGKIYCEVNITPYNNGGGGGG